MFENRFACAEGFAALGANVRVAERTLYVQPGGALHGARLTAPDLRGGAALALAALAARGSSRLGGWSLSGAAMQTLTGFWRGWAHRFGRKYPPGVGL